MGMIKNIAICGSLKSSSAYMEKLKKNILNRVPEVTITLPDGTDTRFNDFVKYIDKISETADLVLILPKAIERNETIVESGGYLQINGADIHIECVGRNFVNYNKIIIGEGTTYKMAVAEHFNKPYYIITDESYVSPTTVL